MDLTTAPPPAPDPRARRRRTWWLAAAGAVVAAVAVVLVVFQPQKLFIDDHVDEQLPGLVALDDVPPSTTAELAPPASDDSGPAPAVPADPLEAAAAEAAELGAPVAVTSGAFASLDHPTSGTALLVVQPDGSRLLRIEDLDTDNGPDLRVVLSTAEVGTGDDGSLVELGALKGNVGDQNYEIPDDLDLSTVRSVVIWCERFSAPFGEAPLVLPEPTAVAAPASPPASPPATVQVVDTPYGPALGDAQGLVLYRWDEEADGQVRCTGDCAETWPPLLAEEITVADGVDATRLSLVTRPDGAQQVALDGVPLYRMDVDEPGTAKCQGGDGWWILHPDGDVNRTLDPVGPRR